MKVARLLTPTHWVYLLAHLLVFAIGIFVIRAADNPTLIGIGTSLVAAGIAGWTVFIYIFVSQGISERLRVLTEFGITNIFDARSVRIRSQYDERLGKARERIDIMGYGLRALREDYFDHFLNWRTRAHVRILLLDPNFPSPSCSFASQRDAEERQNSGDIAQDVEDFIRAVRPVIRSVRDHPFEVRLYRCLPTINIFRVDDEVFFGPYLIKQPSRNSPTILVRRGGILFERVVAHFETIWSDPTLSGAVIDTTE
jgi:hypothetical protein